ncbi:2Fe-2S iron-sulfur cluster-binding protein [Microbacterium sp. NPDC077644]|uniref:2Fe-2S iron-sulfur cluster-binding protein n=1 Tax=Microbacterium sp. NPDC077644 TaxID=3155055 RepID=UPI003450BC69
MPRINYVASDGGLTEVDVAAGKRVMQTALAKGIDGIIGECGGQAMCATCHVYVDDSWLDRLPEMQADEDEMLEDTVCERTDSSRLSCQIAVSDELDGIRVRIPERQV